MTSLFNSFMYIGPGMGAGTIIVVIIILLIILASILMILWIPIKRFFKSLFDK